MTSTKEILLMAKNAVRDMAEVTDKEINKALLNIAERLIDNTDKILLANEKDLLLADGKIAEVMKDRLRLTKDRIAAMAEGVRQIAALPSPLGRVLSERVRPNGLLIEKVSVPLGVIAIIYESRPNVTSDAAALALKSGNVAVLRGGKEAYNSSRAIVDAIEEGLIASGITKNAVKLISDTSRESAKEIMEARGYVDLLIPRGGKGLISACVENAKVPCLETGTGICHIYVDASADVDMALDIVENAKTSRPSVCNAAEVCLVHRDIAKEFLPKLKERLVDKREKNPVELRCDGRALEIIDGVPMIDTDFDTEFLDYILAVGIVDSTKDAVAHIAAHSTSHSEAIITKSDTDADYFTRNVDSSSVYVNASTRFTDGGEFGLGCEMGISTQKMHARGPLGIEELTTYKYIIRGNGQTR
jgi:glutamate-5-semialdehyde dehydrogenase